MSIMKNIGLALILLVSALPAQNKLFESSPEHSYKLFLETPELVEAMYGEPIGENIYYNDGSYAEPWKRRKAVYYFTSDSLQLITYLFDYIYSQDGLRIPIQQFVQKGDYILISVTYTPVFMFNQKIWRDMALKD